MKKTILFLFICISQFTNAKNPPILSECYSYHTPHYYELLAENNMLVFQHTVKDPNGISYVSRDKITLDSITSQAFKIIAEDASTILFSTTDGYFIIEKDIYEVKRNRASKINNSKEISETVGTNFICKNGSWYYTKPKRYSTEIIELEIKNMPTNLEHYLDDALREGTLFKNEEAVYVFNEDKLTFRKIPNLSGKNVKHKKIDHYLKRYFLFDHDTFYYLDFNNIEDYSEQFTSRTEFTNFKNAEIIKHQHEISINTNDGIIWLYTKFSV